jgi:hypothetical protein
MKSWLCVSTYAGRGVQALDWAFTSSLVASVIKYCLLFLVLLEDESFTVIIHKRVNNFHTTGRMRGNEAETMRTVPSTLYRRWKVSCLSWSRRDDLTSPVPNFERYCGPCPRISSPFVSNSGKNFNHTCRVRNIVDLFDDGKLVYRNSTGTNRSILVTSNTESSGIWHTQSQDP